MNMLVILCGLPMIFWVWDAMLTVFACYCFGLAIYREIRVRQEVTEAKQLPPPKVARGKLESKNEHETSKLNSHCDRDCLHRAFPKSASGCSGAERRLSRRQHSGGDNALSSLTSGTYNTAVGLYSLLSIADGRFCTGVGAGTLLNTGDQNTATGAGALLSNSTGWANTANGAFALFRNTTGDENTATGTQALFRNTSGSNNTATALCRAVLQHHRLRQHGHRRSQRSLATPPACATRPPVRDALYQHHWQCQHGHRILRLVSNDRQQKHGHRICSAL